MAGLALALVERTSRVKAEWALVVLRAVWAKGLAQVSSSPPFLKASTTRVGSHPIPLELGDWVNRLSRSRTKATNKAAEIISTISVVRLSSNIGSSK